MNQRGKNVVTAALYASVGVGVIYVVAKYRKDIANKIKSVFNRDPLRHREIVIINTKAQCSHVLNKLKLDCAEYNVVGFDCEWVSVGGRARPVALLQLSSHKGLCALIRLCKLREIPDELREFLEDVNIVKVGIVPNNDAALLRRNYGVRVDSTFDLRFLAALVGVKPEGLGKMSESILKVKLDKNWRISCSDWEANILTEKQIDYAAKDALVAIELFKKLSSDLWKVNKRPKKQTIAEIIGELESYFNVNYFDILKDGSKTSKKQAGKSTKKLDQKRNMSSVSTLSKPLYDNCYMKAPDGELLCMCDRNKAQWYVKNNLGTIVSENPLTVMLNFEPAGRAVGEVGKYYLEEKKNECVVCGKNDSYLRKNIVPREYRKLFPTVMKDHSSHDIILLCTTCHQISNVKDDAFKTELEDMCNPQRPPTGKKQNKSTENHERKQIRSASRALMMNSEAIPDKRKKELETIIKNAYPGKKITNEFLAELMNISIVDTADDYVPHGELVVNHFKSLNGGLVKLERMWREHFLRTMRPKHLSNSWSINHTADRLKIRANEGRVDREDLIIAGMDPSILREPTLFKQGEHSTALDSNAAPSGYNSDDTNSVLSQPSDSHYSDLDEDFSPVLPS